jgi:hypothetical protein
VRTAAFRYGTASAAEGMNFEFSRRFFSPAVSSHTIGAAWEASPLDRGRMLLRWFVGQVGQQVFGLEPIGVGTQRTSIIGL